MQALENLKQRAEDVRREMPDLPRIEVKIIRSEEKIIRPDGELLPLYDRFKEMLRLGRAQTVRPFDIVHFAGHALFPPSNDRERRGFLVFGDQTGARAIPIAKVADVLKKAGVQLVYLSACGSSAEAAACEFARHDLPVSIGFSWNLMDNKAADFATRFYQALIENDLRICDAYRVARWDLWREYNTADPIWASPIMLAQADSWHSIENALTYSRAVYA